MYEKYRFCFSYILVIIPDVTVTVVSHCIPTRPCVSKEIFDLVFLYLSVGKVGGAKMKSGYTNFKHQF